MESSLSTPLENQSLALTVQQPMYIENSRAVSDTSSLIMNTQLDAHILYNSTKSTMTIMEDIIYSKVIITICLFGLLGNLFNILVLTRKGLVKTMDRMEKSAHLGLCALAATDFLFCVCVIPHGFVDTHFSYKSYNFELVYDMYGKIFINIFIQCSTWLTVSMALGRYIAICYPLHARTILGMRSSSLSVIVVLVISVLFNIPRFVIKTIKLMNCENGEFRYYKGDGILRINGTAELIYAWSYFLVGVVLPLVILVYFNVYLILTLRESFLMRQKYRRPGSPPESKHRVTLTLIIIVLMFILLVMPSEAIYFFKGIIMSNASLTDSFNLTIALMNTLQAVNFSFNFLLYCAINEHFRDTVNSLLCQRKGPSSFYQGVSISNNTYPSRNTAISEI